MLIIHLDGSISTEYLYDLERYINNVFILLIDKKFKIFALDLGKIYQIDSRGLGYLIKLLKQTISNEIELILYDLNPTIADLMELSTMDKLFNIMSRERFEYEYLN